MADESESTVRPGIGVDSRGGAVIDPTENVIALVKAGEVTAAALRAADQRFLDAQLTATEKLQNFAREAESKFQNFARDSLSELQTVRTDSETRRIDQLAETRQEFQNTIRDMLAESVRTTSALVSTQLVQIQATFDARVTKLEQAQLTQAGRSSVADPATEAVLNRLTTQVSAVNSELSAMRSAESGVGGQRRGMTDTNARLLAVIMTVATVASVVVAGIAVVSAMHSPPVQPTVSYVPTPTATPAPITVPR